MRPTRRILTTLAFAFLATACNDSKWFGDGRRADVAVTTPAGIQSGPVEIIYTLTGEDGTNADINVFYNVDGGSFRPATEGTGGDGTETLTVSEVGEVHSFVWNSDTDLPGRRETDVSLRIQPDTGVSGTTGTMRLHNARYAAVLEDQSTGRVRLYRVDVQNGDLTALGVSTTGGTDPNEILFDAGRFFVVHRSSNNVSVLSLDEETETLTAVDGSPFAGDGIGSRYLATDGDYLFVSNTAGGTITIYTIGSDGTLSLNVHSGAGASGCRDLVVRSGNLFVASETSDAILVFDIASDGQLLTNSASPVTVGGLSGPVVLARAGSLLYAANSTASTLSALRIQSDGDLTAVTGSPFSLSSGPAQWIHASSTRVFAVTGTGQRLITLSSDAIGALTEDASLTLDGDAFGVRAVESVVQVTSTTHESLSTWTIDATSGLLTATEASPLVVGIGLLRIAYSD